MTPQEAYEQLSGHLLDAIDDGPHEEMDCVECTDNGVEPEKCCDDSIEAINVALTALQYCISHNIDVHPARI